MDELHVRITHCHKENRNIVIPMRTQKASDESIFFTSAVHDHAHTTVSSQHESRSEWVNTRRRVFSVMMPQFENVLKEVYQAQSLLTS